MPDWIEPHQTRLFPKRTGADNTRLSGIAARCDWVLVTDLNRPFTRLIDVTGTRAPRVIFVGLRNAYVALDTLAREILPRLRHPFVLVTGSEDVTVPRQIDSRSRPFDARERAMIRTILDHPLLRHWFAENLDTAGEPRMSPLPVGFVLPQGAPPEGIAVPRVPPLAGRPARVLVAHRVREDRQWDVRRRVTQLARGAWSTVCTVLDEEVPEAEFRALLRSHAFVVCAPGGGLDPSPKAWQALLEGAVPIVERSPLAPAYAELPVAFVPAWEPDTLAPARLAYWQDQFAARIDSPEGRAGVVERLGLDHWWRLIVARWSP